MFMLSSAVNSFMSHVTALVTGRTLISVNVYGPCYTCYGSTDPNPPMTSSFTSSPHLSFSAAAGSLTSGATEVQPHRNYLRYLHQIAAGCTYLR